MGEPEDVTIPEVLHLPSDHVRRVLLSTLSRAHADRLLRELAAVPGVGGEGVVVTDEVRAQVNRDIERARKRRAG